MFLHSRPWNAAVQFPHNGFCVVCLYFLSSDIPFLYSSFVVCAAAVAAPTHSAPTDDVSLLPRSTVHMPVHPTMHYPQQHLHMCAGMREFLTRLLPHPNFYSQPLTHSSLWSRSRLWRICSRLHIFLWICLSTGQIIA